jgi:hypothetical protein
MTLCYRVACAGCVNVCFVVLVLVFVPSVFGKEPTLQVRRVVISRWLRPGKPLSLSQLLVMVL